MLRIAYRQLPGKPPRKLGGAPTLSFSSSWAALNILRDGSVETFCKEAFVPSLPSVLPKGHFHDFPAISKWFSASRTDGNSVVLHDEYLSQFGDAVVAQEYSYFPEQSSREATAVGTLFSRQERPLSGFLYWVKDLSSDGKIRIYLAQACVSALPSKMRDDLPTPEFVTKAGRGDIYDASIWLGISPTYTPLHFDPNPNLFVQLAGHKTVRLLPPDAGHKIFVNMQNSLGKMSSAKFRGEEMMMGEEGRLFEDVIWNDETHGDKAASFGFEAQLAQGDGLFIPKGWWHSVKGTGRGVTASVSYHSFQIESAKC